jgi:alpha-amylase
MLLLRLHRNSRAARRLIVGLFAAAGLGPGLQATPSPTVVVPRFTHPGAGQVYYFLLTDRFANGSSANDTGGIAGGPDDHGFDPTRRTHYHGGDFAGLTARLDYLKNLGVTEIWVTPPFRNQTVRDKPGIGKMSGYHGYWIMDFLHIDPHLGTEAEFRDFIRAAHARGLRVCLDIVVNHTADVINYGGDTAYRKMAEAPYRDATGRPFDARAVAWNGETTPADFPALSAETSFPYRPMVPTDLITAKNPAWLNDVTLYHNRGNRSRTLGESAVHGDFGGLDDLFTENPRVVDGFIDVFRHWLEVHEVDGYRIDTARHVNTEFWQAFIPAIRARARELGRPDFLEFGEVYNDDGDARVLSEYSTHAVLDATLDFGFFVAARKFISQGGAAAKLADFFAQDDYYTDHDSNVHSTTTFLGNHDAGRFAYFLQKDNPGATPAQLAALVRLGHGLLYLARGQPVVYYGDEQGMIGRGGDHEGSREDMFASRTPEFESALLLGTARTGAGDKFDESHPFYLLFRQLAGLRAAHAAFRTGAMIVRPTTEQALFAFSRIDRGERCEYLVAMNNSRATELTSRIPTSQPAGATFRKLFDSHHPGVARVDALTTDEQGGVVVAVEPLQFSVWQATAPLPPPAVPPQISLVAPVGGATLAFSTHEVDGQIFPSRQEIRAEVTTGDGFAEVTFALARASRPGQFELLGTDDNAPYHIFWRPPPDLTPGDELTFIATISDLRGHSASAQTGPIRVAPTGITFGIRGATVPVLKTVLPPERKLSKGKSRTLSVQAGGTLPMEYQWLRDDGEVPGATAASLEVNTPGRYSVLVRNRAGTTVSPATLVSLPP